MSGFGLSNASSSISRFISSFWENIDYLQDAYAEQFHLWLKNKNLRIKINRLDDKTGGNIRSYDSGSIILAYYVII